MNTVITILVTLVMFGFLIAVHELGHYLVARLFHVGIIEYSIGMGPAIHTWEGKNNDFSIRALPIGGYVRMVGELGEELPENLPKAIGKTSINDVSVWKRMLIVLAGPFTNLVISFLLMFVLVTTSSHLASTTVASFQENNVSSQYGLQAEDTILKVNGRTIHCFPDLSYAVMMDGVKPVDILVERNGSEVLLEGVRFAPSEEDGLTLGTFDFYVHEKPKTVWNLIYESFWQGWNSIYVTLDSFRQLFTGRFGLEALGGPVAIGEQVGNVIKQSPSFLDTLRYLGSMTALISVSLGIMNLLPIPALDGGRFVIYAIEGIRRKPLPKKVETAMTAGTMILLFILMALVFLKDLIHLF